MVKIMKLLQDSKGGILSKETLSNAVQAVMSEYQKENCKKI